MPAVSFRRGAPQTRQNQFGGSGGGPIKKDRLFVFGYYQRLEDRPETGSSANQAPFRRATRRRLHRARAESAIPLTRLPASPCSIPSAALASPATSSVPSCISPAAKKILDAVRAGHADNSFVSLNPQPSSNYSYMSRVDFLQSSKHNLYGHFYRDSYSANKHHRVYQEVHVKNHVDTTNYSVTSTYTVTPDLINEATYDYMLTTSSNDPIEKLTPEAMGIKGFRRASTAKGFRSAWRACSASARPTRTARITRTGTSATR